VGSLGPREGEAEGFWEIRSVALYGDTLVVHDARRSRAVLLDLTGAVLAWQPVPADPLALLPLTGRRLVVTGSRDPETRARHTLEIIRPDGVRERVVDTQFELPEPGTRPGYGTALARTDNGFWAALPTEYRIARYADSGAYQTSVVREVGWFPAHVYARMQPGTPPTPRFEDVREDAAGRLWTLVWIADPDWNDPANFRKARVEGQMFVGRLEDYYDSVIEVLHAGTGRLIAQGRFDDLITGFVGDGMVVSLTHDVSGRTVIRVVRVRVVESS